MMYICTYIADLSSYPKPTGASQVHHWHATLGLRRAAQVACQGGGHATGHSGHGDPVNGNPWYFLVI